MASSASIELRLEEKATDVGGMKAMDRAEVLERTNTEKRDGLEQSLHVNI